MDTVLKRKKYDTFVIWLYNQHKENILPAGFRQSIPASTSSAWRNNNYDLYVGHEFRDIQQQSFEYYELFQRYRNLKKVFYIISKVWISVSDIALPVIRKDKKNEERIIDLTQQLFTVLKKKTVLRIAGFSAAAFHYKINKLRRKCTGSMIELCLKKHPLQVSSAEIRKMKSLLTDPHFMCWPISSIAWHAQRKENLHLSLATWYKYIQLLNINRFKLVSVNKTKGIVSSYPNQFLHVDTTYWQLEDNKKAAIAIVSDNFSKAILGWSIALNNSAHNVIASLNMAFQTINDIYPDKLNIKLIVDGGAENNASSVTSLLQNTNHPAIIKLIAQKDIVFSNSPIEAINKIVKKYLRFYQPQTFTKLKECFGNIYQDYNFNRPHHSIKGLTPMESYRNDIKLPDFTSQKAIAKASRIENNRKSICRIC